MEAVCWVHWPGRKHQKTDDDSPDLRDLMNFQKELDRMADLRVCAVCGEEHGNHLFPTTLTYDPKDNFFIPMDSDSKRQLILVDQNSDEQCSFAADAAQNSAKEKGQSGLCTLNQRTSD